MKKSRTVFGSDGELKAYEAISNHLPEGWRLYGNTPLSQIVDIKRGELDEKRWNFYLKASVDFVLTDATHEPVLAIEFDGLGGGYSSGKTYVLDAPVRRDRHRESKMRFKIDTCYSVGLPLIVISFEEIRLKYDDVLSVVNSIVGMYIAYRQYKHTIEVWDRENRGDGKTWEEMAWDLSVLETELAHKNDPFLSRLEAIWDEFIKLGASWTMTSLSEPDLSTAMKEKKQIDLVGCRFTAKGGKLRVPLAITVWVRNFAGEEMLPIFSSAFFPSHGINPLKVAENIAWYLGAKRALEVSASPPD